MMFKYYALAASIIILAGSIIWHAETGRFQIAVIGPAGGEFDEGSFIKFDRRTAEAVEYCDLYKGYCQKWEKWRKYKDQNSSTLEDMIVRKKAQ